MIVVGEQVFEIDPMRDIQLFWGVTQTFDFYHLEVIEPWIASKPTFYCTLTARNTLRGFVYPTGAQFADGTVYGAIEHCAAQFTDCDIYMAGPIRTIHESLRVLAARGITRERIVVDSYGASKHAYLNEAEHK